jgi:hypothetical protein
MSSNILPVVVHKKTSGAVRLLELFLLFAGLSVMAFIAIKIVSGQTTATSCKDPQVKDHVTGNCHDPCPSGYNYVDPYGCLSCDPSQDPSCNICLKGTECGDNGSCLKIGSGSVCQCNNGYYGKTCTDTCVSDTECGPGKCKDGGCDCTGTKFSGEHCEKDKSMCSDDVCQPPGCIFDGTNPNNPTCKCATGWTSSGDSDTWCDSCLKGRGPDPATDCSKKQFPARVLTTKCHDFQTPAATDSRISSWCAAAFGDKATVTTVNGNENVQGDDCSITDRQYYCNTNGPYWANSDYNPASFPAYSGHDKDQIPPGFVAIQV